MAHRRLVAGAVVAHDARLGETTVNSLPNELLVAIFEIGNQAPTYPQAYRAPRSLRPRPKHGAGIASLVCRRWREIVKRTPFLWMTSLIFNGCCTEENIRVQARWLELPSSGDLDIVIDLDLPEDLLVLILDILLPHCRRWRALLVTQGPSGLALVARRINNIAYKFPRLRQFSCSRINPPLDPYQVAGGPPLLEIELDNFEPRLEKRRAFGNGPRIRKGLSNSNEPHLPQSRPH